MRNFEFQDEHCYHIFNRGVDKRDVFLDDKDFIRLIKSMREFNQIEPIGSFYKKYYQKINLTSGVQHPIGCWTPQVLPKECLVEFICFCLNPNHYHFLIKQLLEGGISEFMKRLSGGYTNYFNRKYNRSGSLFEGKFKAVQVKDYSHFLKLAVYINCNSEVHQICPADKWPWSSYLDYIGERDGILCNKEIIMDEFQNSLVFKNFCNQVLPDIIEAKELKKYFLD